MVGRLSCNQCNDGKQPRNLGGREPSGVREPCNVCHGSGWMPYYIQSMMSDATLLQYMHPESVAHFRKEASANRESGK